MRDIDYNHIHQRLPEEDEQEREAEKEGRAEESF